MDEDACIECQDPGSAEWIITNSADDSEYLVCAIHIPQVLSQINTTMAGLTRIEKEAVAHG